MERQEKKGTSGRLVQKLVLVTALCFLCNGCFVLIPFIETDLDDAALRRGCHTCSAPKETVQVPQTVAQTPRRIVRAKRKPDPVVRLIRQLYDEDTVIRIHAASSLGYMGSRANRAVGPLIAKLHDDHKRVRRAAAQALGKIGSSRAVQPLARSLRDRNPWVAHSAAEALRKIGTPKAREALREYRS